MFCHCFSFIFIFYHAKYFIIYAFFWAAYIAALWAKFLNFKEKFLYKLSSAWVLADDDLIRVETCTDPCGPNQSDEAASTVADDDLIRVETCTDPCDPNWSDKAASTAADDDLIRVETCTDPCGPKPSDQVASTAADDDLINNF